MCIGKGRLVLKTGLKSKAQKLLLLTNMAPVRGTQRPAMSIIGHFTVVGLVPWPLKEREAEVDLVLIQTSFLL